MHRFPHMLLQLAAVVTALRLAAVADVTVRVDVSRTLNTTTPASVGINTLCWFDSDRHHDRARPLAEALAEMRLGTLRYGDSMGVWSVPPYSNAIPTAARHGGSDSSRSNRSIYNADGTYVDNKLSFDEFIGMAQAVGAQPCIVIASQAYRNPQNADWVMSRAQLIEAAAEYVRYANLTHGYNIRYWEIGNETSLNNGMGSGAGQSPEEYAADVRDFSIAMKAVDPTIRIGAGADWSEARVDTLLAQCVTHIDFMISHSYGNYVGGYADFLRWPATATEVQMINARLDALPPEHRDRIEIAVTEFGTTATFSDNERNDTWHALGNFERLGRLLEQPRVRFALQWTAHWYTSDTFWGNALTDTGNALTPLGHVNALWGQAIKTRMVRATNPTNIVQTFATADAQNMPNVLLLNKAETPTDVTVVFDPPVAPRVGKRTVFRGLAPDDLAPTVSVEPPVVVSGNQIVLTLPPLSATVIELIPGSTANGPAAPGDLTARAFDAGRVDLTWTDNALNETGFKLRWSTQPNADNGDFALPTIDTAAWTLTGLAADTTYYVKIKATNRWGDSAYTAPVPVTTPPAGFTNWLAGTVHRAVRGIAAGTDDAEEDAGGTVWLDSSDLDLVFDLNNPERGNQTVGLRFADVPTPRGSVIVGARIQFTARMSERAATPMDVTIAGLASDNVPTFSVGAGGITSRPRTARTASWSDPGAWKTGLAGPHARTPELRAIVQELVDRPGWTNGQALGFVFTGSGTRTAWASEGADGRQGPVLHLAWTTNQWDRLWCDLHLTNGVIAIDFPTPQFAGEAGESGLNPYFSLERSTNLVAGNWTGVPGFTNRPGDGAPLRYTNAPTAAAEYFRVRTRIE